MDLASYRKREGLSLSALATRLGRPVSTVHGWLSGERRPDWTSLEAIVAATGGAVSADDFLPRRPGGLAETQTPLAPTDPLVIEAARALGVDVAAVCARALREAVSAEKGRRWLEENREAIEAWNVWVEEHGLPLEEYRLW